MKTLNPYINFSGKCQQALAFYETAFNGKVTVRQTFGQSPQAVSGANPAHIMHAEFMAEGIYFMATDGFKANSQNNSAYNLSTDSNTITLNLIFTDGHEQQTVFDALSEGGEVTMPLNKTFWGSRLGKIKDPFGINWILNHTLNK